MERKQMGYRRQPREADQSYIPCPLWTERIRDAKDKNYRLLSSKCTICNLESGQKRNGTEGDKGRLQNHHQNACDDPREQETQVVFA